MSTPRDESDVELPRRLTADERLQIYEEEHRRLERSAPPLSKKAKILIAIYLLGCVLIYFGIPQSFLEFVGTRKWVYQPETDIFRSLINAAVEMARPFLAVLVVGWTIAIPVGIVFGVWAWGGDFVRFVRRLSRRPDE